MGSMRKSAGIAKWQDDQLEKENEKDQIQEVDKWDEEEQEDQLYSDSKII